MTNQTQPTPPTAWQSFGRFLLGLTRLILFALVVALVIGAIYLSAPYAYRYILLPVQNNRAVIEHLRRTQAQLRDDLNKQLAAQQERIAQLETALAAEREIRSELENKLAQQAEAMSALVEIEANFQVQGQTIAALEESMDALDLFLDDLESTVARVEQDITVPDSRVAGLQTQTLVLQMNQAILKARLHLVENNAGQAQLALEQVEQALEQLKSLDSPAKGEELAKIQTQLEAVATAIEEQPFIAIQELEILWQLLQEFSKPISN